jgi:hypothetical protein
LPHYRARAILISCAAFAFLISGCATPLAPGYSIQKESLSVQFVPGSSPHLAIRADYQLRNVGNAPLHRIPIEFPGEKTFGRANLRAQIDGKNVTLQHNPHEAPDDWRIPLASDWRQKQKINLTLSYDLATVPPADARIFVAPKMFYLNDSGWFPGLMGFKAFLSPAIVRPSPTDLRVTLPADFRVTASGQPRGEKKQNGEVEYRFLIHKGDFDPYVLAGQYSEQRVSTAGVTVAIWTFKPISAEQAQKTATQIAGADRFYVQNFGPLPQAIKDIYDIQPPEEVSAGDITWKRWEDLLLPGIVFDSFGAGSDSAVSNFVAPTEVANTWFGHMIRPRPEAWMFDFVLAVYASDRLDESNAAGTPRAFAISVDLTDYDYHASRALERPIISLLSTDTPEQVLIGGAKVELFLFALEDKCGQQNVTHAIHDMVYALRGEDYGYNDFRAALEQQCRQDLAGFFRTWLTQPGIPADFRARYENPGAKNNTQ